MNALVLPGYSPHNSDWAYEVKKSLDPQFNVVVHEWSHWKDSLKAFSVKNEIGLIISKTNEINSLNVIAKSIGTLVCMHLLDNLIINKVILCGIPLNDIQNEDKTAYDKLSSVNPNMVIIFQNNEDPHGNFSEIHTFIGRINSKIVVVNKKTVTHDYPYYKEFVEFFHSGI